MNELVVISGKGGTGKTSIVASFAVLAERPVLADCDVDAADLHLVLSPEVVRRELFRSGHEAVLRQDQCVGCGQCVDDCRFEAVIREDAQPDRPLFRIDSTACEGCGVCVRFCPAQAIDFPERTCGEWFVSRTRCGPMVHARLGIAAENSGKLVSIVRREAKKIAEKEGRKTIIVDGPPGIGCPVIASITGASLVLVVAEPTMSAEHDLERVLALTRHFAIPAAVSINKSDLNPGITARIEKRAAATGAFMAGRSRYDPTVVRGQVRGLSPVECSDSTAGTDIRSIWSNLQRIGADHGIHL